MLLQLDEKDDGDGSSPASEMARGRFCGRGGGEDVVVKVTMTSTVDGRLQDAESLASSSSFGVVVPLKEEEEEEERLISLESLTG